MASHSPSQDLADYADTKGMNELPGKKRKMDTESDLAAISDEEGDVIDSKHIASPSSNASTTSAPSMISSATSGVIAYGSGIHSDINFKIVVNDGKSVSHYFPNIIALFR